jgi:LysM repeat protein
MSAAARAQQFAAPHMSMLETHGLTAIPPGGEMAALSGAPGAMPGAEQISPLINMIMKMPGHIGLVSSFFECLGAFFAPAQEMLGHIVEGLDVGNLFEHAGSAGDAFSEMLESAGEHVSVDMNLLPADAPIFDQLGHPGIGDFADGTGPGLGEGAPQLSDSFNNAPRLEVGGSPNHPLFEMAPQGLSFNSPGHEYLAMEPNHGFGATIGNFNPPSASTPLPQATPQAHLSQAVHTAPHAAAHAPAHPAAEAVSHHTAPAHHTSALDFRRDALSSSREHLLGNGHHAPAQAADLATEVQPPAPAANQSDVWSAQPATPEAGQQLSPEAAQQAAPEAGAESNRLADVQGEGKVAGETYTVHKGDNLWDIAHDKLGDGARWQEIYDMNKSVLGDNPRMIMPGTELQMPGGDAIASGGTDYTVQSGDSLWNISQEHMGGGQNWHELYQNNEAVVGSNPAMIHPGQHLHLDGAGHGQTVAADGAGSGVAHGGGHNMAAGQHSHHLASHPHAPSHSHGAASHIAGQPGASNHVAHAAGGQHQPVAEMKAQAQSLSSAQTYGDAATHVVDSSTQVPNSHL